MKRLFYCLCALNVLYLLWQFHAGNINLPEKPADSQPAWSGMLLLSEYRAARRGVTIAHVIDQTIADWRREALDGTLERLRTDKDGGEVDAVFQRLVTRDARSRAFKIERSCFVAGPFVDGDALKTWLANNGLESRRIEQRETVSVKDYQVFYPAAKTTEQSRKDKVMLESKGLQGLWMISVGDNKGAWSIGVFSDAQRAMNYKNQLMERGVQVAVGPRTESKTHHFADVMLDKRQVQKFRQLDVHLTRCGNR